MMGKTPVNSDRLLTHAPHGHILTHAGVWSPDSQWIVYDVRSDPAGSIFDGNRIEAVHRLTGEVRVLFESKDGANCGVVTCSPVDDRIVFIHGPESPTSDWSYGPAHRRGVIVHREQPGQGRTLDACQLVPPFVPGALRGGSHVHTFSGDGQWIAFTYEDHILSQPGAQARNQRNVGVAVPLGPVIVSRDHPRHHDGSHFCVLVTRTHDQPRPGSDEISRAYEDSWVGRAGYVRPDGERQRAIAFQGLVAEGHAEVFIVDLPDDLTQPDTEPLAGTLHTRPAPPRGCQQRRLTWTSGLSGPRHWLRSSHDGERIAFLMADRAGIVQLWTISPRGSDLTQLTDNPHDIGSAFSWSPDDRFIAHVMNGQVCITDTRSGSTTPLTALADTSPPRPEACVFSPDGQHIAFVRPIPMNGVLWNQIAVVSPWR